MRWEDSNPRVSQSDLCPNLDTDYMHDFGKLALSLGAKCSCL